MIDALGVFGICVITVVVVVLGYEFMKSDPRNFEWRGVPSGHIACTHGQSLDELHCVVESKSYICIRDWRASVVECAAGSVMR